LIPATILDPFAGAGTTGVVAAKLGRDAVLIELNPEYCRMATARLKKELGMLAEIIKS
jgi:DNA modification methylase